MVLQILIKQLSKDIFRHMYYNGDLQPIQYDIKQIFDNHYKEIINLYANDCLYDYIKALFINPILSHELIEIVYFNLDYQCTVRLEKEAEEIEKYL